MRVNGEARRACARALRAGEPFYANPFRLRSGLRMANFHIVRHLQSGIGFFFEFGYGNCKTGPGFGFGNCNFTIVRELQFSFGNSTAIAKQAPDLGTGIAILQ